MVSDVSVVNYGLGNVFSLQNMLRSANISVSEVRNATDVGYAQRLILPGVGHFGHAMNLLARDSWIEALRDYALSGRPLLGVCLGGQLLGQYSEEGEVEGLKLLEFQVRKLAPKREPVPHVGWGEIHISNPIHWWPVSSRPRFYFSHSYYMDAEPHEVIANVEYGGTIPCLVGKENLVGAQFHPEKSHAHGKEFLLRFSKWNP